MVLAYDETRFTPQQIEELKGSAISSAIAERQGLYSIDDAKAAAKLFGRRAKDWEGHLPVLVLPYRLPFQRDPVLVRGKPARPFETRNAKDDSVSLTKYVQAKGTGSHLFFGPSLWDGDALRDVSIPLWITEGEKKCLSAESHGLCCIALPGVTQWHLKGEKKQLHPYFAHVALRGRRIYLAFDADALANKDVRAQELALARALEAAGADVRIVRFPQDAAKIDDFLATHELSELHALAQAAETHGRVPPDTSGPSDDDWRSVFEKLRLDADSTLPIKDVDNIARILLHHPVWQGVLAFDARKERQVFLREPPFTTDVALEKQKIPRPVTDTDVYRVADWLVAQGCLGWSTEPKTTQVEQALALVCERNRIDRVRDYLVKLTWDGTPRLDAMASYFGAKDSPYTRTVFAKWMLSAVARARTPGCQVDHVLVLEGPQGAGKSTALRVLAGEENFSDTVPEIPSRDAHEHCIGPWIIELAELDHMRKSEVTALKAFISARAPSFRSAYARRTMEHPRRCVFAGTTNETGYLADSTGNRRFWPVECTKVDLEALSRDRDQLWAEALARVRAGEQWHITDAALHAEVEEEQAARRQVDPWHPLVARFVAGRRHVTQADVLDYLGYGPEEQLGFGSFQYRTKEDTKKARPAWRYDQRSANRIAAILRDLGWVRRMVRVDGARVWRYENPGGVTSGGGTGDRAVTGQVVDIAAKSPVSPVSPVDPLNTVRARTCDAPTPDIRLPSASSPSLSTASINFNSGDTGDSGDSVEITGGSDVTSVSPVSADTGDTIPKRPAKVF